MLLIVAHHYVVNSGLFEVLQNSPFTIASSSMLIFGAWGKTGINCFVFITGYFMCKSNFSWRKLLKLYLQIVFYAIIIYGIFCITGHEKFSLIKAVLQLWPIKSITDGFTSCFLLFFLFIPFLNKFVGVLSKKEHGCLVLLLTAIYAVLPQIPKLHLSFNYVSWFMVIYIIASYVRLHGMPVIMNHKQWGLLSLGLILLGSLSVFGMELIYKNSYIQQFAPYIFVADSNRLLSIVIAVSSFMYFKDMKIPYSRLINTIGGATFGILLIHANSDTMRQWLWKETVDCVGNFEDSVLWNPCYAFVSVLLIFIVCAGIDWFRVKYIEPKLLSFICTIFKRTGVDVIP